MPRGTKLDHDTLEAALVGYQHELDRIETQMAEVRRRIDGAGGRASAAAAGPGRPRLVRKKRRLSAAGRRNIIAATKKRWALFRAQKAAAKKAAKA